MKRWAVALRDEGGRGDWIKDMIPRGCDGEREEGKKEYKRGRTM